MTIIERLKYAWAILWNGKIPPVLLPKHERLERMLQRQSYLAAKLAVEKVQMDRHFGTPHSMDSDKRKEAVTWATHYLRDKFGVTLRSPAWELNFLVEWCVGERRGKL